MFLCLHWERIITLRKEQAIPRSRRPHLFYKPLLEAVFGLLKSLSEETAFVAWLAKPDDNGKRVSAILDVYIS